MNSNELRFDGKVVVITGAGLGIGRELALFYGKRGAKLLLNDLGCSVNGEGSSNLPADLLLKELKFLGLDVLVNYDSVENGEKIIKSALDRFGKIDILINNAGIINPNPLKKMQKKQWDSIINTHLNGVFTCTKASFEHMVKQKSGKIINISSPIGLYGMGGFSNYSCAKAGIIGFSRSLAKEGGKYNVFCNVIAPIAYTRMTANVIREKYSEKYKPEFIASLVGYLTHESCKENGMIFEIIGRWISKVRLQRSEGVYFSENFGAEEVKKRFEEIKNFDKNFDFPENSTSALSIMNAAEERSLNFNKLNKKICENVKPKF